jgi:pyruvate/2-oxoacid:ferredoxin oxidoreductase beta subunit
MEAVTTQYNLEEYELEFNEYIALKQQEKYLKSSIKEKESKLLPIMQSNNLRSLKFEDATFSVVSRKKFEYSEEVQQLESRLKMLKIKEETQHIAKEVEGSISLQVRLK